MFTSKGLMSASRKPAERQPCAKRTYLAQILAHIWHTERIWIKKELIFQ